MVDNNTILEYYNSTVTDGVTCYDMINDVQLGINHIFFNISYENSSFRHHKLSSMSIEEYNNYIISQRKKKIEKIRYGNR